MRQGDVEIGMFADPGGVFLPTSTLTIFIMPLCFSDYCAYTQLQHEPIKHKSDSLSLCLSCSLASSYSPSYEPNNHNKCYVLYPSIEIISTRLQYLFNGYLCKSRYFIATYWRARTGSKYLKLNILIYISM